MLLLKKWLKKKCENLVKDDNVSTTPQSVDDPSSPSTSDDPNLSTIHVVPSTPTTIHDDDDDKNDQASPTTIINDDDDTNPPPRTSTPSSPNVNESRRPLITPLSSVTTSPDVEEECVARNTRSKRQLKF